VTGTPTAYLIGRDGLLIGSAVGPRPWTSPSGRALLHALFPEALYEDGKTGLRWWSAFSGDWHTIVAFCGRLGGAGLVFREAEPLGLDHPVVRTAAAELGVRLAGTRRARR